MQRRINDLRTSGAFHSLKLSKFHAFLNTKCFFRPSAVSSNLWSLAECNKAIDQSHDVTGLTSQPSKEKAVVEGFETVDNDAQLKQTRKRVRIASKRARGSKRGRTASRLARSSSVMGPTAVMLGTSEGPGGGRWWQKRKNGQSLSGAVEDANDCCLPRRRSRSRASSTPSAIWLPTKPAGRPATICVPLSPSDRGSFAPKATRRHPEIAATRPDRDDVRPAAAVRVRVHCRRMRSNSNSNRLSQQQQIDDSDSFIQAEHPRALRRAARGTRRRPPCP